MAAMKRSLFSINEPTDAATPSMVISTWEADREGDRVLPQGGDFSDYRRNPVLVWSHDYKQIPIGRVTSLNVTPNKSISATWRWLQNDPFADRVRNAYEQGVLNSSSIGFIPKESTPNGSGYDITRWIMLELTLCAIPMNPSATRTLKSLGLYRNDEKTFDVDSRDVARTVGTVFRQALSQGIANAVARGVSRARGGVPDDGDVVLTLSNNFGASGDYLEIVDPLPDRSVHQRSHAHPRYMDRSADWNAIRAELKSFAGPPVSTFDRVLVHECAPDDLRFLTRFEAAFVRDRARTLGLIP